jgi:hypothetical protein
VAMQLTNSQCLSATITHFMASSMNAKWLFQATYTCPFHFFPTLFTHHKLTSKSLSSFWVFNSYYYLFIYNYFWSSIIIIIIIIIYLFIIVSSDIGTGLSKMGILVIVTTTILESFWII